MSSIIKPLKTKLEDGTEQVVFPKTLPEAVIDSETGKTLDVVLDEINTSMNDLNDKVDNIEITGGGVDEINTYLQRKPPKNLLEVTAITQQIANLGTSIIVNNDKSITHSGTQIGTNIDWSIGKASLKANTEYILSGCPKGGSISTYALRVNTNANSQVWPSDVGEGVTFTVEEDGEYNVDIILRVGVTYDGITYYPMVREATVEDATYEPYYEDAMTMVNYLNDNALVHGDVVDNLNSRRTDLPLSANQGNKLSNMIVIKPISIQFTADMGVNTWQYNLSYVSPTNGAVSDSRFIMYHVVVSAEEILAQTGLNISKVIGVKKIYPIHSSGGGGFSKFLSSSYSIDNEYMRVFLFAQNNGNGGDFSPTYRLDLVMLNL